MPTGDAPSSTSPSGSTLAVTVIQHGRKCYYNLAQRLRQLLPSSCKWLESDDVQITATTAFSSGAFSEIWKGSLQGSPVAVKSLRCYSSPEFDPAEVGIVSISPLHAAETALTEHSQRFLKEASASSQLSHPNIVPFLGVYSAPNHPFALLYAMMDNHDLGRYLADHPSVSRLELVSTALTISVTGHRPTPHFLSSSGFHVG